MKKLLLLTVIISFNYGDILCQQAGNDIEQYGLVYDDESEDKEDREEAIEKMQSASSDVFNYCPSRELTIMGELLNKIEEIKKVCSNHHTVESALGDTLLTYLVDQNLTKDTIVTMAKESSKDIDKICEVVK